jgi:TPR repeat protein
MRRFLLASTILFCAAPAFAAPLDPPVDCAARQPAAAQLCQRANGGDAAAQAEFALQLYGGVEGPADPETGIAIARVAAREGNAAALALLATAYEEGALGEPDDVAARALFKAAADAGSVTAQASLGDYLIRGVGGPRQAEEGQRLLRGAADRGDRQAVFLLGTLLFEGVEGVVARDEAEANRLIRRAAELGHPAALHYLASTALAANGDLAEAERFADGAVRASPSNGAFVDTLAQIVARRGDAARALTLYARVAQLAPDCASCLVRYADLLAAGNRRNDARRIYRQALEANRRNPEEGFNEAEIRRRSR